MEDALCEYTGAKHAQCLRSGTVALISGLFAAECGPGDEVLTVAYTWTATVGAILRVNAEGVFAVAYVNDANYRFAPDSKPLEAGGPIHLRTMFQERDLYGKGCPFRCPHVQDPPVYRKGDLPVSEEMAEREFCLHQSHLSPRATSETCN